MIKNLHQLLFRFTVSQINDKLFLLDFLNRRKYDDIEHANDNINFEEVISVMSISVHLQTVEYRHQNTECKIFQPFRHDKNVNHQCWKVVYHANEVWNEVANLSWTCDSLLECFSDFLLLESKGTYDVFELVDAFLVVSVDF